MEDRILHSADLSPLMLAPLAAGEPVQHEVVQTDAAPATQAWQELVFIDSGVSGVDQLLLDLQAQRQAGRPVEVVLIDADQDGISLISSTLEGRSGIGAVHVIAHGSDAALQLGNARLDAQSLMARAVAITGWGEALSADADLLLYGCNVAQSERGEAFVRDLAWLTGADVAASADITGAAALGGNWALEYRSGSIEAGVAIDTAGQTAWAGTLTVVQIDAAQDTYLNKSAVGSNYGTAGSLVVDRSGGSYGDQRALLQFNLGSIPAAAVITSATLQMQATANPSAFDVDVYQVTDAWSQGSGNGASGAPNWNERMSGSAWTAGPGGSFDSTAVATLNSATTGQHTWNLTSLVQAWVNGSLANNGIMLASQSAGTSTVTYDSREGATPPRLVVNYTVPPNTAPVLNAARSPALQAVAEDASAPVGAVGSLVSTLVDFATPAGQVDNVTDTDPGALLGIAVRAADSSQGSWWYSTNNGASWNALGAVDRTAARLLAADASTRLYFKPGADYNGTLASAITFHAWDRSSGTNGALVDMTGSTSVLDQFTTVAYGNNDGSRNWNGNWVESDSGAGGAGNGKVRINGGELSFNSDAADSIYRSVDLSQAFGATLTFDYVTSTGSGGPGLLVQASGNGGASYTTLLTLTKNSPAASGSATLDLTPYLGSDTRIRFLADPQGKSVVVDLDNVRVDYTGMLTGASTAFSLASDTASLVVTAVNDAPQISAPAAQATLINTPATFSAGNGNAVTVGDVDAGAAPVQVKLTAINGTVSLGGTAGLGFSVGTGTANATMTFNGMLAAINAALDGLRFDPAAGFTGSTTLAIDVNDLGNSGSGGALAASRLVQVNVTATNSAPVLSGANDLAAIDEDAASNSGTSVAALLAGQVSDANTGALSGIAVTGVDDSHGQWQWQYTLDGGANWLAFGTPSAANARLLGADAATRVRFVPAANWNGTVAGGLGFRAWDRTSGSAGALADTSTGSYAVRDNFDAVSYGNNDGNAAWASGWVDSDGSASGGQIAISGGKLNFAGGLLSTSSIYRQVDLSGSSGATLSFDYANNMLLASMTLEVSSNGGASYTTLASSFAAGDNTASFDLSPYASGNTRIRFTINGVLGGAGFTADNLQIAFTRPLNGGSTAFSSASASSSITVRSLNDPPAGTDTTLSVAKGGSRTLVRGDFGFADGGGESDAFVAVRVQVPSAGTLSLGGTAIAAATEVSVAQLDAGLLVFTPAAGGSGTPYATIGFQVRDGGGTANGGLDLDPTPDTLRIDVPNATPVITSDGGAATAALVVPENTTVVTTVTATDADGDTLVYGIAGGADAARFSIGAGGTLRFVAAPNFEAPLDADADNVYEVVVQASDGAAVSTQALTVTVSDVIGAPGASSGTLWFSTAGSQPASAGNPAWTAGQVLQYGDLGDRFDLDGGLTDGSVDPLAGFTAPAPIAGMHHVQTALRIGDNSGSNTAFDLNPGDLLLTLEAASVTLNDGTPQAFTADARDVVVFRPVAAGDYSAGQYVMLFDDGVKDGGASYDVLALSLIETATTVGGTLLPAGTVVVAHSGPAAHNSLFTFTATSTGSGNTVTSDAALLLDGNLLGLAPGGDAIAGLHVLVSPTAFDDQVLAAGTVLVSIGGPHVFGGVAADAFDVIALNVSGTGASTAATGQLLFDGSDLPSAGLTSPLRGFTVLTGAVANSVPAAATPIADQSASEDAPFSFTVPAGSFTDADAGDVLSYSAGLPGGGALPAWLSFDAATRTFSGTPANGDVGATTIRVTATDLQAAYASADFTLTVVNVNDAPVLAGARDLDTIAEDAAGNPGTLVASLISGQVGDVDAGALAGIAVIGVDDAHGVWQYSTDGGTLWSAFGSVGDGAARLLAADATSRVRFVPAADWSGNATLTLRAWDRSSGSAGGTANLLATGGSTAFSSASAVSRIVVTPVNDAPTGRPMISGSATEDQTLSVSTSGIADAEGLGAFSYQWLRDGVAIGGATGTTLLLGDGDVGKSISVRVDYVDGQGTAERVTSTATAPVANVNDAPTGLPLIAGTATEDQLLSVDTSGIVDLDGLGGFGFQWLRDGAAISGATGSTLLLGDADVGKAISVRVRYLDLRGTAESLTSAATGVVLNLNDAPTGLPLISGNATQNQTLTAGTAAIADADGLGSFSYQWLRDGTAINGATTSTLLLGQADVGARISVRVAYLDGHGTGEALTSGATAPVANVNDAPTGLPLITGNATEDQVLSVDTAAIADIDGLGSFSYQWLRNGVAISGATGSSLQLGDADVGKVIRVRVAYVDGQGSSESVTSAATGAVQNVNDAPTGLPTIAGSAIEDRTLSANVSAIADADGLGSFRYQWLRNGAAIGGATASTLLLGDADVGQVIGLQVSYVDAQGTTERLTSAPTAAVLNVNDAPRGSNGTLAVDRNGSRTLRSADFGFADTGGEGNALLSVLMQVPSSGSLRLAGTLISAPTEVTRAQLDAGMLVFAPVPGASGTSQATIGFQVRDDGGTANGGLDLDPVRRSLSVDIVNHAPTITSHGGAASVALSVAENTSAVTTIAASDPDADAPVYSIAGGADAARFKVDAATGALSFVVPPNFEAPTDGGADNVYQVVVRASDGLLSADQAFAVSVGNVVEALQNTVELPVNGVTADAQETAMVTRGSTHAVAIAPNGEHLVVWSSRNQDGNGWGVYAQRFDKAGVAIGEATLVNQTTAGEQLWASVAMDLSGRAIVTWTSTNQDGTPYSIYARRYNADGSASGSEFRVNATGTGSQYNSTVAVDGNGNFIVAWEGNGPGDSDGIFARRFRADGSAIDATEFRVSTDTSRGHHSPSVAMNSTGAFAVLWDNNDGVQIRRYDSNGSALGGQIRGTDESSAGNGSIALADDGSIVAVWRETQLGRAVVMQRFSANGSAIGGNALVNTTVSSDQTNPSIAMDGQGNFIVAWEGNGTGDGNGVFAQKFSASGNRVGSEFRLNITTTGTQSKVSLAMLDLDNLVAVWSGQGATDGDGVFMRQYGSLNSAPVLTGANALAPVAEDAAINRGTLVSALVAGKLGDVDDPGALGIAVTGVDDSHGRWQYSTDGGLSWSAFGAVDAGTARLLAADALTAVRFVADADWNGSVAGGLQFRGWDLRNGNAGATADVTVNGGTSAFSAAVAASSITVTPVNDAPLGLPVVAGSAIEDQVLVADLSGLSDVDGLGPFSLQWLRNGVVIGGATGTSLTLGDADVGKTIRLRVSYTDLGGTVEVLTSAATAVVANVNDAPTGLPRIVGSAIEDRTLSADLGGVADADGLGAFSLQWQRDGVAIAGATGSSLRLGDADVGRSISLRVTYVDGQASAESLVSAGTAPVENVNDAPTGAPLIVGSAVEDRTLTADLGGIADADGLGAFTLQWLRDGAVIGGATGTSLVLGDADVGHRISVRVGYVDGHGTVEALTSAATAAVANVNDAPTGLPLIVGEAVEDQTLRADLSTIADADGLGPFNLQWLRNGAVIDGATGSELRLGELDDGQLISLRVRYVDGHGHAEVLDSAPTAPVLAVNDAPVLNTPLGDRRAIVGTPFVLPIPAGTFTDSDIGDRLGWTVTLADGGALPPWLTFDAGSGTLAGTPGRDDLGSLAIRLTVTDTAGVSASDEFVLDVVLTNAAPTSNGLADQAASQGTPFVLALPAGSFADSDIGDVLSYRATLANGTALPTWLGFDAATQRFTGTPANGDVGELAIRVTATDLAGASVSSGFTLRVANVNDAPLATPIANQLVLQDQPIVLDIAGHFTDIDVGDRLRVDVGLATGAPLPAWLRFDASSGRLSGTPGNDAVGSWVLRATATDAQGATASLDFTLTVANVNDAPRLTAALENRRATDGLPFTATIPADRFIDIDAGDALRFSATLASGAALPDWLVFDAQALRFSGTPVNTDIGTLVVRITATDSAGAAVSGSFRLTVDNRNDPPTLVAPLPDQAATQDQPWRWTLPAGSFDDLDVDDVLRYSASLASGAPLPAWLSFDAQTQTFSGTPGNADVGEWRLRIAVVDLEGSTAAGDLVLRVANVNDAPVLAGAAELAPILESQFDNPGTRVADFVKGMIADVDAGAVSGIAVVAVDNSHGTWQYSTDGQHWLDFGTVGEASARLLAADATTAVRFVPVDRWRGTVTGGLTLRAWDQTSGVAGQVADTGPRRADSAFSSDTARVGIVVTPVNHAPELVLPIAEQAAVESQVFEWRLPPASFVDSDAGDVLAYRATLANGAPLPAWLSFDPATQTFKGRPLSTDIGTMTVRVIATDAAGAAAQSVFTIRVAAIPVLATAPAAEPLAEAPATTAPATGDAVAAPAAAPTGLLLTNPVDPWAGREPAVADTVLNTTTPIVVADFKPVPVDRLEVSRPGSRDDAVLAALPATTFTSLSAGVAAQWLQNDDMLRKFDDLQHQMHDLGQQQQQIVASSLAISSGLSIGYVVWLVRGGVLVSSMLSALPAWQMIDPMPVLAAAGAVKKGRGRFGLRKGADGDDHAVEQLFDGAANRDEPASMPATPPSPAPEGTPPSRTAEAASPGSAS